MFRSFVRGCVAMLTVAMLAACAGSFSRGMFEGFVMGQTEDAVIAKVGKPDTAETTDPKERRFIYKARTFDSNGTGQQDVEAMVIFEKNATGNFVVTRVLFS